MFEIDFTAIHRNIYYIYDYLKRDVMFLKMYREMSLIGSFFHYIFNRTR